MAKNKFDFELLTGRCEMVKKNDKGIRVSFLALVMSFIVSLPCIVPAKGLVKSWTREIGTKGSDEATGVAVGGAGNLYIAGYIDGALDGNTYAGSGDAVLIKYDPNGKKIWTKVIGTEKTDAAMGICSDGGKSIYVVGYTFGGLDESKNAGNMDAFLVKYDVQGNKIWTRQFGTSQDDYGKKVVADKSGNVYITGWTFGDMDGNENSGMGDVFLIKCDSAGNKIWTRQFGTKYGDRGMALALDGSGNIIVTGATMGNLGGNASAGAGGVFIVKYNSSGEKIWTKQYSNEGGSVAREVVIDSDGNIYLAGYTEGSFGDKPCAGMTDIFVMKCDPEGNKIWAKQLGTEKPDCGKGICIDKSGKIYVTGFTEGKEGLVGNKHFGFGDIFLAAYDFSGKKLWVKQFGGSEYDFGAAVKTDKEGNVYITGYTENSLDGNVCAGKKDIFLMKMIPQN